MSLRLTLIRQVFFEVPTSEALSASKRV